jgi:NTE family protein
VLLAAVRIDGARRVPEASLRGMMESQPGQLFDAATAERDMRRLFGRGDFEHVSYAVDTLADGRHQMTTTVSEKSWGPQYLRLGLGVSTDFSGDSFFSLRASHRWTWLNALGAEWRNDIEIGHTDRLRTEWLQPMTPAQRLFGSAHLSAERTPLDIYLKGERLARYRNESVTAGADLGLPLAEWGEARIGVTRGHVQLLSDTSFVPPSELYAKARTAGLHARLRIDTLDNKNFPRAGVDADLQMYSSRTALGADSNYNKLTFKAQSAYAYAAHSVQVATEVQRKFGAAELPDQELISFGGFLRMSGYRTGQLVGSSLHFGRVVYNYRISSPGLLDGAYFGVSAELGRMGNTADAQDSEQTVRSNAVYIALDTPLGPLYLGAGRASRNQKALYLLIGKP